MASGLVNTTQQVGGALGLAVLATLATTRTNSLAAHGASSAVALTNGYHLAFTIAAILLLVAIGLGVVLLRGSRDVEVAHGASAADEFEPEEGLAYLEEAA